MTATYGDDALGRRLERLLEPGDLAERVVERRLVAQAAYMEWRREEIERLDGSRHVRFVVGHPGAVAILAIDAPNEASITRASELLMVRQFRTPVDRLLLEVPAGKRDREGGAAEVAAVAAARELEEETGLLAASWRHLAGFYTAPGFTDERMELFLAFDLRPAGPGRRGPDAGECLEPVRLSIGDGLEAARRGAIVDAKSLLAVEAAVRLADRPGGR